MTTPMTRLLSGLRTRFAAPSFARRSREPCPSQWLPFKILQASEQYVSGAPPAFPDGQRKGWIGPQAAAARREFDALERHLHAIEVGDIMMQTVNREKDVQSLLS